jgi:membrane associated rhomboid family serine protease
MAWHDTWNNEPPRGGGFMTDRGGAFPPGVKLILILTVGAFLLQMAFHGLTRAGSVSFADLAHLEVWRLVTYMFLHGGTNHILINMFMFWMLGSTLERQMGTWNFLYLYFAAGVAGGLCEAGFNLAMFYQSGQEMFLAIPSVGASAGVMGILMAFATLNPRAKFLLFFLVPVEAWWVALGYAALETWPIVNDLFLTRGGAWTDNVAHAAHFGGMVVGFVWIRYGQRLSHLARPRVERSQAPFVERPPDEEEAELDRILDKIHNEGLDSLSLRERMFLQEISRKRRGP